MVILQIACDNIYMFKNFKLDLTYNRRINHPLAQNDLLFPGSRIKVRKNLVIMGSNASGKTTFGKLLRFVLSFICGRNFEDASNDVVAGIQYNKKRPAQFEIEFAIDHTAYLLKAIFANQQLIHEELRYCNINAFYNIAALRNKLADTSNVLEYTLEPGNAKTGFPSHLFSANQPEITSFIKRHTAYFFRFSQFHSFSIGSPLPPNIKRINHILPRIDNSVKGVEELRGAKERTKTLSYLIKFYNGELLTVPDGNLSRCGERLSHGTFEVINFLSVLDELNAFSYGTWYVDEQLPHIHSELEAYLIRHAFFNRGNSAQLFFTTHNVEILEINIPIHSFIFFRRDKNGTNEALFPSDVLTKNDRSLRGYYENDYFGVLPDYSALDQFLTLRKKDEAKKNG